MKQNQKRNRNRLRLRIALMIAILLTACVFPGAAFAYTTDRYDIDVIVREDNSYQVKERIDVNFDKQQRGIFRYIPVYDDEIRKTMKITDVDTGDVPHKTYEENGKFVIRLGDEDTYVTGPQQYEISYLVRIYDDKNVESDVLYYDLLPKEWETPVSLCELNMKLPKPVKKWRSRFTRQPTAATQRMKTYTGVTMKTRICCGLPAQNCRRAPALRSIFR